MGHWVYIQYSRTADRFYVGETADIELRSEQHRTHHYRGSYTTITVYLGVVFCQLRSASRPAHPMGVASQFGWVLLKTERACMCRPFLSRRSRINDP
ncbi:MAG: GIY-YIG nuclease family protein [Flavobacteriales bacterium]